MVNLIGTERQDSWLGISGARLYWYDKVVRPGRKVGHINLHDTDTERLTANLQALLPLLPENYDEVITWLQRSLANRG
jgi:5-(carboxyamino)imidazole ribonucleotide synthase